MGDDDCLKPSLTEMKLEPADNDGDLIQSPNIRKADKVSFRYAEYPILLLFTLREAGY